MVPRRPAAASQPELVATQSDAAGRLVGSSAEGWPHVRGTPPATPDQGSRPRPSAPVRHRPLDQRSLPVVPLPQPPRSPTPLEKDGLLGDDSGQLAVALLDDTLAGIVAWRSIETGGPDGGCLEIGAPWCFPSTAAGLGTAAQGLLVEYLFATTLANRLQAITNWRTWPSSERWSASDSAAKALCVASPSTVDAGTTECSMPAFGTTPPDYPRLAAGWCVRSSGE